MLESLTLDMRVLGKDHNEDHTNTNAFWETTAQKCKEINHDPLFNQDDSVGSKENHFARIIQSGKSPFQPLFYLEELIESSRDTLEFPCLVTESTQEALKKPGNNLYSSATGAIIIVQESEENGDYYAQHAALTECSTIADKMFSYLRKYLNDNPTEGLIDISRFAIYKLGPILDGHFEARLEFGIRLDNPSSRFCFVEAHWQ